MILNNETVAFASNAKVGSLDEQFSRYCVRNSCDSFPIGGMLGIPLAKSLKHMIAMIQPRDLQLHRF